MAKKEKTEEESKEPEEGFDGAQTDKEVKERLKEQNKKPLFSPTGPVGKNLELTKPIITRLRNRLKEIKKLSSAKHEKEMRGNTAIWHTRSPEMFISGLDAVVQNNVGTITYHRYVKDGDKKKVKIQKSKSPYTGKEIEVNAEYVQECLVIETIERHKPIKIQTYEV